MASLTNLLLFYYSNNYMKLLPSSKLATGKAQHQKRMSRDHKCILKKQNNNNNNNHDSGKRRKITFIYSRSKLKIFKHFIKKIKAKTQNQKKKDQI